VIDDQINWNLRVNLHWINSKLGNCISHSSKIYNCWNTGEILEKNSSWLEWNFYVLSVSDLPVEDFFNVLFGDGEVITVSDG
jgi:hypothetical protein